MNDFRIVSGALLFLMTVSGPAIGQELIDDFSDSDLSGWEQFDTLPGAARPATFDVVDGEYVMQSRGPASQDLGVGSWWASSTDPTYSNGLLRVTVRANSVGPLAGIVMRWSNDSGYFFAGDSLQGAFFAAKLSPEGWAEFAIPDLEFAVGEDWTIEGGIVEDIVSMTVWKPEDSKPSEPQLQRIDPDPLRFDTFGLLSWVRGDDPMSYPIDAAFDDVYFTTEALGDCNRDGSLTSADLTCVNSIASRDVVLGALNTLPGDLDGDGNVDFADFLVLSSNFGKFLPRYTDGNVNLEQRVDFADFLELSANFGKTPTVSAVVPEPRVPMFVALIALGFRAVSRRRAPKSRSTLRRSSGRTREPSEKQCATLTRCVLSLALFFLLQSTPLFAATMVYNVDLAGTFDGSGHELRVLGRIAADTSTDFVTTSDLLFFHQGVQIGGTMSMGGTGGLPSPWEATPTSLFFVPSPTIVPQNGGVGWAGTETELDAFLNLRNDPMREHTLQFANFAPGAFDVDEVSLGAGRILIGRAVPEPGGVICLPIGVLAFLSRTRKLRHSSRRPLCGKEFAEQLAESGDHAD